MNSPMEKRVGVFIAFADASPREAVASAYHSQQTVLADSMSIVRCLNAAWLKSRVVP